MRVRARCMLSRGAWSFVEGGWKKKARKIDCKARQTLPKKIEPRSGSRAFSRFDLPPPSSEARGPAQEVAEALLLLRRMIRPPQ
jgi:hypothetical protein